MIIRTLMCYTYTTCIITLQVGQIIAAEAAKSNLKRVTLELGGKSPVIVMPDANCEFMEGIYVVSLTERDNFTQQCVY